jgi:hypothetical protein
MIVLRESAGKPEYIEYPLDESSSDKSFGIQEGRNLCRKITERSRTSNTGGLDMTVIRDSVAGVVDGLNVHILQISEKEKSPVLNKLSLVLDDAFTEISKIR